MIVDCISDMHGYLPETEGGDLLIIAGDITARDLPRQLEEFYDWLNKQDYRKKIVVAGNHDGYFYGCWESGVVPFGLPNTDYLCDSGTEFEGYKIWGSPWQPEFCDWYFNLPRGQHLKEKWASIPYNTDILVTHGPPFGILDITQIARGEYENQGCRDLRDKIIQDLNLDLHVFGHIHEGAGMERKHGTNHKPGGTIYVNASQVDVRYRPIHKPIRVELPDGVSKDKQPVEA